VGADGRATIERSTEREDWAIMALREDSA